MNRIEISNFPALDYATAESINTLCVNLSFSGENVRKIMSTSCQALEGKSFLSMNMFRTLAGLGKRVALVDADLRRSMIESKFGMHVIEGQGYGLTHYLAGMCNLEEVVYSTNYPGGYIVPVGREVTNSLPLLNTTRLTRLLDKLASQMDFVIVDAPPVGMIIDAAEIAKSCDGALFVVNYNTVRRRQLLEAKQQIERSGCMVLGAVLNKVTFDTYSSKRYYYKSYYSHYNKYYQSVNDPQANTGRAEGKKQQR